MLELSWVSLDKSLAFSGSQLQGPGWPQGWEEAFGTATPTSRLRHRTRPAGAAGALLVRPSAFTVPKPLALLLLASLQGPEQRKPHPFQK